MKTKGYIAASSCISPQSTDGTNGLPESWTYAVTDRLEVMRPDYVKYIDPRQVRRMGKSVRLALCAGNLCIDAFGSKPDSIITATGLGSMGSTEKFMNQMLDNQEENLIPYAFLQTTFNTSGAQIALQHKIHGYNMTWVHKGISFELALIDALTLMENNESEIALVGGFDEMTKDHAYVMHKAGLVGHGEVDVQQMYTKNHPVAGEAAAFFMITNENRGPQIKSVVAESGKLSQETIASKVAQAMDEAGWQGECDLLLIGENGLPSHDNLLSQALSQMTCPVARFKHLCGEFETSSAFALWLAQGFLNNTAQLEQLLAPKSEMPEKMQRILIVNLFSDDNLGVVALEKA